MIELLLFLGLFGSTTLAASSGGSDNDESEDDNTDIEFPKFNSDLFKPGNHLTHTRYWENSSTGDYIKHTIDIDIDE